LDNWHNTVRSNTTQYNYATHYDTVMIHNAMQGCSPKKKWGIPETGLHETIITLHYFEPITLSLSLFW